MPLYTIRGSGICGIYLLRKGITSRLSQQARMRYYDCMYISELWMGDITEAGDRGWWSGHIQKLIMSAQKKQARHGGMRWTARGKMQRMALKCGVQPRQVSGTHQNQNTENLGQLDFAFQIVAL